MAGKRTNKKGPAKKRGNGAAKDLAEERGSAQCQSDSVPKSSSNSRRDSSNSSFAVVGIGASAGALDAFKQFFTAMRDGNDMAFVLIQHLDPTHESLTAELLRRHTDLKVIEISDEMAVEPNHIYVIPPNKYLTIRDQTLHLMQPLERRGLRVPIDYFFRSLAQDQQERGIGVILSGAGSDGALGIREIKAAGGMVVVQDPETAAHDGMPRSAIAAGVVDHIVPIARMPELLSSYVNHAYVNGTDHDPQRAEKKPSIDHMATIIALLRARTKYDFSGYKKGTIHRRIMRRMGLRQVEQVADYLDILRGEEGEISALYKDLLINVTNFFREPGAWEELCRVVVDPWIEQCEQGGTLRVWVPGCATGEEAYSIAMLLSEKLQQAEKNCGINIFASDIDADALTFARAGIYPENIAADVTPERLKRFFVKGEHTYRINKELRESVVFAEQNVISDPPFSKLDLISCRNLLIYLEPEIQKRVLLLFHFGLNPGGSLFLGGSETVSQQHNLFQPVSRKWRIFRRIGAARHERLDLPSRSQSTEPSGREGRHELKTVPARRLNALSQQLVLARFAPACALINRKMEVLFLHGPVDDYLQLPPGEPVADLIAMARPGLRTRLRTAVYQAIANNQPVKVTDAHVRRGQKYFPLRFEIEPVHIPKDAEGLFLISFDRPEDQASRPAPGMEPSQTPAAAMDATKDFEGIVRHLEEELATTREDLQSTIEELETSNEEFKAANEEVTSVNEELQSSNEELETSKEELQSLNEELQTVNCQLEQKVAELESTNNDISNLLSSTDIATIFLDRHFQLRRFTPPMQRLLRIIESDIGRPITDFARNFADEHLLSDAQQVLQRLAPIEREMQDHQNRWYLRRILPYRTDDDRIQGVVITFNDITRRKEYEDSLRSMNADLERRVVERTEEANRLIEYSPDGIVIVNNKGQIQQVNRQTEAMFGYHRDELIGRSAQMLLTEQNREQAQKPRGEFFPFQDARAADAETTLRGLRKDGSQFPLNVLMDPLELRGQPVVLAVMRDVTEQERARKIEEHLAAIVNASSVAIIGVLPDGRIESWNPGAEAMFGYTAHQAIGREYNMIVPRDHAGEFERTVERLKRNDDVRDYESVRLHKDGSRIDVALTISLLKDAAANVTGACALIRDIRERKHLEKQIAELTDNERQKLGRELHDSLSQQITGLGMLATALHRDLPDGSPAAVLAGKIESNLQEAKDQIRQMTKGVSPVDIDVEGLRAALDTLARDVANNHRIACDIQFPEDLQLDDNFVATQMFLIAREAIHNAVKHADAKRISVAVQAHDDGLLQLSVEDDGIGVDAQADQRNGHAHHAVSMRLDGRKPECRVFRTGDNGDVRGFAVSFENRGFAMSTRTITSAGQKRSASLDRRFLLIDDHELVRFGLSQLIARVPGWSVCGECDDVAGAMRLIRQHSPQLAVIDLSLKEGNGIDLIKQISANFPEIKILVFSMHEEALYAERSLRAGAHGYVHKQQPARSILTAIRRVLEGKTYLSPDQTQRLLSRASGRSSVDRAPVDSLSDRELQVFEMIGRGITVKQIAKELHVSAKTVEYHRDHIKEKLGVKNSAEVTRRATIWTLERE